MILSRVKLYPQQRLDLEDLNTLLSAARTDAKLYTKQFLSSQNYILKGLSVTGIGLKSATIEMDNTTFIMGAGSQDLSYFVSEDSPSDIIVPDADLVDGARNYVELQLSYEDGTPITKAFWDPSANGGLGAEFNQQVNTVTDLVATAVVVSGGFTGNPDRIPVAIIDTDGSGNIKVILDRRNLFFRLGTPSDPENEFTWASQEEPTYLVNITSPVGTFTSGETVTFSGGATATVVVGGTTDIAVRLPTNTNFASGNTITGGSSGATGTVNTVYENFTGADKDIGDMRELVMALMTEIKRLKGTPYWHQANATSVSGLTAYANSAIVGLTSGARYSWSGTQLSITDDNGVPASTDNIAKIKFFGNSGVMNLRRQDASNTPISIADGEVLFIKLPDTGGRNYSGTGSGDTNYQVVAANSFQTIDENFWIAYREGGKLYIRGYGELMTGESAEISDPISTQILTFIGAVNEADSDPNYTTSNLVTQGSSLVNSISELDAATAKLFEDRNISLHDGGIITLDAAGTSVSFTQSLKLYVNTKIAGGSPILVDLAATSRAFTANGNMLYAVINRVAGTATITADAATLPAQIQANQEVFLIAKRVDSGDGTKRVMFRNGFGISAGQSSRLGSAGTIYSSEFAILDTTAPTKKVIFDLSGATAAKTLTIFSVITDDRSITLPDATTTLVGHNNVQTISNKIIDNTNTVTLKDTNFTIQDDADATKQFKFEASAITAGQIRTYTTPDQNTTLVGRDTTDILTNKTLQFLRQAVADNATTGTAATLSAFTTGIVRLTSGTLISLAGFPAGVSGQELRLENKTGNSVTILNEDAGATAANRVLTGTNGSVAMLNDSTFIFTYDATSSRWMLTGGSGSGSGTGKVNFITAGNAETNNPFIGYVYTAGTRPVASTGGPGTSFLTATISNTAPLDGNSSFLISKTNAVNQQGISEDIPFTVPLAYRGKVVTIEFDHILVSGTFQVGSATQDSDLICYVIDVDNNVAIEPSNFKFLSASTTVSTRFAASFQTSINSSNYRLAFYTATGNTPVYVMKIDNISVSPSEYVYGTPITDYSLYSPIFANLGAASGTFQMSRKGQNLFVQFRLQMGTGGGGIASFTIPAGLTAKMDTTRLAVGKWNGDATITQGGLAMTGNGANTVTFFRDDGNAAVDLTGAGIGNNSLINGWFEVPITGWSSSVQTSDQTDTRVISAKISGSTASTASGAVLSTTLQFDTHGGFSSSRYTIPVAGYYQIKGNARQSTAVNFTIYAYVDAVLTEELVGFNSTDVTSSSYSTTRFFNAGQIVDIRPNNTVTLAQFTFAINRVSGPSAIAATETVACRYNMTNTQNLNTSATALTFSGQDYDTHGSFNSANATFSAPANGLYEFSLERCTITFNPTANFNSTDINVSVAGQSLVNYIATFSGTRQQLHVGGAKITARLNQGQTAQFTAIRGSNFTTCNFEAGSIAVRRVGN